MQAVSVDMNKDKLIDCLSMFNLCDQHPRTLYKLADYSAITQDTKGMFSK